FRGAIFDGQHVDFMPGHQTSRIDVMAQYDRIGAFGDAGSWKALNTYEINDQAKGGTHGAFDGNFVYIIPSIGANSSVLLRQDVRSEFADPTRWEVLDLRSIFPAIPTTAGFFCGAFDGRYLYLVSDPASPTPSVLMRYDTQGALDKPASWESFDLS